MHPRIPSLSPLLNKSSLALFWNQLITQSKSLNSRFYLARAFDVSGAGSIFKRFALCSWVQGEDTKNGLSTLDERSGGHRFLHWIVRGRLFDI